MTIELIGNPWIQGIAATVDALVYVWAIFCLLAIAAHIFRQRSWENQAMARERTLSKNIKAAVRERGGRPIKYHGSCYSESGIPDLLICYRGWFVWIESKQPGEWSTPIQVQRQKELTKTGAIGGVCVSVGMAMTLLDAVDRKLDELITGKKFTGLLDK